MRIMVLMNSLNTGGAESSTLSLYQWLASREQVIQLICIKKTSPSLDPAEFGFSDNLQYLSGKSFFSRARSLVQIIKKFKPDLVHSVLFDANLLGRWARLSTRNFIHLESLVNEMYSEHRLKDPHITRLKLNGYRLLDRVTQSLGVDHFHATSKSVAEHYQKKLGIDPKRITVVERGRSTNEYVGNQQSRNQQRTALAIREDEVVLLMVGRQEFQKGYDVLLKALSQLPKEGNWTCLCVGREGNATQELVSIMKKLNLEGKVKWLGHRNDVMTLMAMSDIFVFPSRFEGLPGVLIEAEAAALPIVCCDISNNREVVKENENALLFVVDTAVEMAVQIEKLLYDQPLREKMGAASLEIFNEQFQCERSHARMEELLRYKIKNITYKPISHPQP